MALIGAARVESEQLYQTVYKRQTVAAAAAAAAAAYVWLNVQVWRIQQRPNHSHHSKEAT
jgi:S-adenosylmethionine:tRNA-ribosyltransferase-isomerase (queuine synthetase)